MRLSLTVHDPRLPAPSARFDLARRPDDLGGRAVLLYDNGKLAPAFGGYAAAFEVLAAELEGRGAQVRRDGSDLLAATLASLDVVADEICRRDPAGVILGVCDTGVSMPTTILAAALEARGVPTSILAYGIGATVARATLQRLLPGVPVADLDSDRTATADEVRREFEGGAADEVLWGLTASRTQLRDRFDDAERLPSVSTRPGDLLELDVGDVTDPAALDAGDAGDATYTFTRLMSDSGLGDGFPLTPPTVGRVAAMVAAMGGGADEQVWPSMIPRMAPVTLRDVAVVAVMAGCSPELGRLVLAAYRAMAADEFRLFQAAITTHPAGTLVLVSGPEVERVGLATGAGALGPGNAANAALGRAVALSYNALLGLRPRGGDLSVQGSPAEYSYCVAEDSNASPWPGHHVDGAGATGSVVTVLKCEGPQNVLDNVNTTPEALLSCIAANLHGVGRNNAYVPRAQSVVFLSAEHAGIIAAAGWTRDDVRRYLYDVARAPREVLLRGGITPIWPAWMQQLERIPIAREAEDVLVVVAGGHGPQSSVALPWGYSRGVSTVI